MSNQSGMKDGESSMEQTEILLTIRRQLTMLQSTIDSLKEQSRQKDEEIERLRQIILNLQRAQFGQRSEKRTYVLDDGNQQLTLFDTPEKSEEKSSSEPSQNSEGEGNPCLRPQPEEKAHAGRALCVAACGRENRGSAG